ncbi:adenylate/guanylate cyclase domain-containing protein [Bythopirellula polymerisocia]|uniref:Adenylate cyclase 1 n=1 Tax=Bythopirellula polymerisocia TaxID=2528003 RepID=A0A5C6CSD7_9BACT|nr:adenylate/guanylate cyclase domain-containing protein [Bythopirellula polymerisocia]TWU25996.1 Adenylate cyclase 1 [Bythopirellula polymerisocia]
MQPTPTSIACDSLTNRKDWSFAERHGLLLVGISPIVANLIGSAFNILYNQQQIWPILTEAQRERFDLCWQLFNLFVYPVAVACWAAPLIWLRNIHRAMLRGEQVDQVALSAAQRTVINLPWWILIVAGVSWLVCIPVFPAALATVPGKLSPAVVWNLVTSFVTASLIAITHSFFAVELVSQRTLYPVFFQQTSPAHVPGAVPLNITARGILWALSAVVSPIVSLVLLLVVPDASHQTPGFGIAVGLVAIAFGLTTAWMLGKLVAVPVRQLKDASLRVSEGDLDVRVNLQRADDFGPLIDGFNGMVEGLQERERLQETFGRHVGQEAARQILQQGEGLVGNEQEITVMFVDVRNFTEHSSKHSPQEVVAALNIFFRGAVETIENHGGMVNKFLGDGFMALFGIGVQPTNHALQAVTAAQQLFCCLGDVTSELELAGWPGLQIGVGINTGPAIVGSIGSPKRQEYTAIGDTVNVASRVESLTKILGHRLLITGNTKNLLPAETPCLPLPPQAVKGKGVPVQVFGIAEE